MITFMIQDYLHEMEQSKSELTVKNHKSTLKTFVEFTGVNDPVEVLTRDVMRWKKELLANGQASTANTKLKRVKMFFNWCIDQKILQDNPADEIRLVSEAEALPKWLKEDQQDKLLRAVKRDSIGNHLADSKKSYRDYTIVLMMLKTGIRLQELVDLKWTDLTLQDRKGQVLIRGKHGQQRTVTIVSDLLRVLKDYKTFDGLKFMPDGSAGPYVFYSQMSPQISSRTIQTMINKYSEVIGEELTPHMLRHTFGHDLIVGGMQPESVARLMGHIKRDGTPNIAQTARYTMANQAEIDDHMENILGVN